MCVRRRLDLDLSLSPVEVYDALDADVILEGTQRGWETSYVGADPFESFRYSRSGDNPGDNGLGKLSDWLDSFEERFGATHARAFGYIGYEISGEIEDTVDVSTSSGSGSVSESESEPEYCLPDIAFDIYGTVVEIDDEVVISTVEYPGESVPPERRAEEAKEALLDYDGFRRVGSDELDITEIESNFTEEDYRKAVTDVKEYIREGDTFQSNISQRLSFSTDADPLSLYAELRRSDPAHYMGLLSYGEYAVVSSSPELLVRKRGDSISTRPIAGTRPRGDSSEEDERLERQLRDSSKEIAEHSILVDLARNDLGKVSEYGTVEVDPFAEVEKYSEVQHLESVVNGRKRDDADLVDVIEAVFPGGTVTGAPKPRTLSVIDEAEPNERGPYTGSMGVIKPDGDMTLNILIRTVFKDGDEHYLHVGGGVVHDSDPKAEYDETLQKAEGSLKALGLSKTQTETQTQTEGSEEKTETETETQTGLRQ
ncbi:MAG: anthranilate synthase component I family protein [Halobacteria archaeon]|nr:anthranilate synthase component I family protein [Halobacteria archaeon]